MRLADEMDRLILAAVCDDFTTLECILDKVVDEHSGKLDRTDTQNRLIRLVSGKLINANLLHAEPPFITPLQIGSGGIHSSWFYITQRGRKCLSNSARKYPQARRSSANRPGESEYTSAVNF